MLKPSSQRWRIRVSAGSSSGVPATGSGIICEGVSSPPRVMPLPRKRDGGAAAAGSPPGLAAFLNIVSRGSDNWRD